MIRFAKLRMYTSVCICYVNSSLGFDQSLGKILVWTVVVRKSCRSREMQMLQCNWFENFFAPIGIDSAEMWSSSIWPYMITQTTLPSLPRSPPGQKCRSLRVNSYFKRQPNGLSHVAFDNPTMTESALIMTQLSLLRTIGL